MHACTDRHFHLPVPGAKQAISENIKSDYAQQADTRSGRKHAQYARVPSIMAPIYRWIMEDN